MPLRNGLRHFLPFLKKERLMSATIKKVIRKANFKGMPNYS